jgi:hypothetical protein
MSQRKLKNHNLFLSLLRSITFQLRDDKVIDLFSASTKYKVIEIQTERAYNVYTIRRNLKERSPEQTKQFDDALSNISRYAGDEMLIHAMILQENLIMFFTSIDGEEMFGYIAFDGSEERVED